MRVLVTGASGFVGSHLVPELLRAHQVVAATQRPGRAPQGAVEVVVGSIDGHTEWGDALDGVNAVVHLAARVHVLKETAAEPLAEYRAVNTDGTLRLAQAAADAGVARFVFLSSIAVHGKITSEVPVSRTSATAPVNFYGATKLEAEAGLAQVARQSALQVVTLRPPVVYGAGAGGNVRRIAGAVKRGVPLPVGSIRNKRTMLAIENLILAIQAALEVVDVPPQPVVLGDMSPVSTRDMALLLAQGLGRSARLVPIPVRLLRLGGTALGRADDTERLTRDFVIDPDWEALNIDTARLVTPREGLIALGRSLRTETPVP